LAVAAPVSRGTEGPYDGDIG